MNIPPGEGLPESRHPVRLSYAGYGMNSPGALRNGFVSRRAKPGSGRSTPGPPMICWLEEARGTRCIACDAAEVAERPERTAQGYRRFRCRVCGKQFNERSGQILNRAQYPSDVIALVVFWRLRYKLSLRDLPEMFLIRGSNSPTRPFVTGRRNSCRP